MALPTSGPLSLGAVNIELGLSRTTLIKMGQSIVRTLAGVASGTIKLSQLRGKGTPIAGTPRTINLAAAIRVAGSSGYTLEYVGHSPTPTPAYGSVSPSSLDGVPIHSLYLYRGIDNNHFPHSIQIALTTTGDGGITAIKGIQIGGLSFGNPTSKYPGSSKTNVAAATWNITVEQHTAIKSAIANKTTPVLIYK